ncbi:penicillin-binding protein 1A [Companilactobacillus sp. RD055328]|uniref:transglycosylase domain-containing protein n=1 Tax=Companilactobacillus sp. RD055328 TaxID=2916634 RepID=UPI001FC8892F|nr:PBP1A family penicillin-binding protein [Companilactobacillus sp. RD055328]GKQ42686.1 penicillin-binding protein 1A [Companilactobacillus sp. RD055328]
MAEEKTTRKQIRNKKPKRKALTIIKWGLLVLTLFIIAGVGVFAYYASQAPEISTSTLQDAGSATIYDRNGKKIMNLGNEERDYAKISEIPTQLQDAVISIEDKRFYNEPLGIDPIRIVGAGLNNIKSNSIQGGGSTLTQQLVKLSYFSTNKSDQTFERKIKEIWLSMKVEKQYSKKKILEFYMNKVYLSNGINGMKTASKYYFNKDMKDLTLAQTAMLAGMPQSPTGYDPYVHPTEAKNRRDTVLQAMYNNKKISKTDMKAAMDTPITDGLQEKSSITSATETRKISDPYIKEVISEVKKKGYDPYRDNIKITTNMDYDAQKLLYKIVNSNTYVYYPDSTMQVASTIVDPNNGKVIAMIGGRNQGDVQLGYNRAVQSSRSNGSTMKPLLDYAPAIEYLDWSTYHQVYDEAYNYPGTSISLHDVDNQYMGKMSLRSALSKSRNIPAVKTLDEVGFNRAKEFVKQLGINIPDNAGLSAGIGSEVSTLQNAAAYSAFANGGYYRKPYYVSKVETFDGIVHKYSSSAKRVMKESTAFMITDVLKDVIKPGGLGANAYIAGLYQAGKSGTTDYSEQELKRNPALSGLAKDAWFAGYTKNYSMSIWAGYDKPSENGLSMTSRTISQKIYKYMMQYLQQNTENKDWTAPGDIVQVNGEWFLSGTVPASFTHQEESSTDDTTTDETETDSESDQDVVEDPDETTEPDENMDNNEVGDTTTDPSVDTQQARNFNRSITSTHKTNSKNWRRQSENNKKLIKLLTFNLMI